MATLFGGPSYSQVMQLAQSNASKEIDNYNADALLNTPESDVIQYMLRKYHLDVPSIVEEGITQDHHEITRSGRNSWGDSITHRGTVYSLFIPFTGDKNAFSVVPSTSTVLMNDVEVQDTELVVKFGLQNGDSRFLKDEIQHFVSHLKSNLAILTQNLEVQDRSLRTAVERKLTERRGKLLADRNVASALGFPLRQRSDAVITYSVPTIQRKIEPQPPRASAGAFKPEPTVNEAEYQRILDIIENMTILMERTPSSFVGTHEETLRDHILLALNAHYEGQATGETFNAAGKTDILIRHDNANIFIAECKFWKGQKALHDAIDQLLGYCTWRDTKTALILFNRNGSFTSVLHTIQEAVPNHSQYVQLDKQRSETSFRYKMRLPNDSSRHVIVTVLAFDVPAPQAAATATEQ